MNAEILGYEVQIDDETPIDVGKVFTHQFTGLVPETDNYFRVRSYDTEGNRSAWSNHISATTDAAPAISLVAHVGKSGSATSTGTSDPIDTSGATLLVMAVTYVDGTPRTPSDSKGNTWTALTPVLANSTGSHPYVQLFYVENPTVGSGHTFSTAGSGTAYPSLAVAAFDHTKLSSAFDDESGTGSTGSGATTMQPGTITPAEDNELFVTALANVSGSAPSIDSDFIITDDVSYVLSTSYGVVLAYKVQTSAAAENPTWSGNGGTIRLAATMAAFKHE